MNKSILILLSYCCLYALLNVSGAAIIKYNLKGRTLSGIGDWINFLFHIPVLLAFFLIFLSALTMFKALSAGEFSSAVPIATGINFGLTLLAGYFLFKDHINVQTIIGFLLIIAGIIIISLNQYAK